LHLAAHETTMQYVARVFLYAVACLQISAASVVAQRVSMCRPMVQPNSGNACRNAPTRACHARSSAAAGREQANPPHALDLLRARRERPCHRRAAERG
jgi:hypothetical protein